jgi:hypothetical protein
MVFTMTLLSCYALSEWGGVDLGAQVMRQQERL